MGPQTGPALQTIAALGHFGLFEFEGSGDRRGARLTELAFNILLDKQPTSPERDELIRQAALKPKIHNELWQKWQAALPSDFTFETYLVRDRGFSEAGARDLIPEYKATLAFAKLNQSGYIPPENSAASFEEDDDGEDNPGRKQEEEPESAKRRREVRAGMKEDVFTLKEGDVVLQWPERLSVESYLDLETWAQLMLRKIKRSVEEATGVHEQFKRIDEHMSKRPGKTGSEFIDDPD
jgi:hypothetical protein